MRSNLRSWLVPCRCGAWAQRLLGLLGVSIGLGGLAAWASPLPPKVLIIGIDGTMPSALAVARTPNLDALKAQGCFSDRAITHPVTHSAACWSAMFTGVWGDKNGVNYTNNAFTGQRFDLYPNFFKRLEDFDPALNTMAFTRWADIRQALAGVDGITNFSSDDLITAATCRLLTNGNPDVFFTILLDVDSAGHSSGWGPTVTNYVSEIEKADRRVGLMMQALTNRTTYASEDWLVIVMSDHGQHDNTLERSRLTFHLVAGPSAARGALYPTPMIVDVCTTVLTHMGIPIHPAWNLDGRVEGMPAPPTRYGTNLIYNGDAESNSGTNNYTPNRGIAWWWDHDSTTLGVYGAHPDFPSGASPGPTNRGNQFFLGGTNDATVTQTIELKDLDADLADPGVEYELSGWFGGKGAEDDRAALSVTFFDAVGLTLASNSLAPVYAAERDGITGLQPRSTNGVLPSATRFVRFDLAMRKSAGVNDASADDLAFRLQPRPDAPLVARAIGSTEEGWAVECASQTNRVYRLQRSADLAAWNPVSPWSPGTSFPLVLTDTNPPPDQGFYQVERQRP